MLGREKSTYLAGLFSVELKFTIETLNAWFSNTIKSKSLDINNVKKQIFIKKNPILPSKTICYNCGFSFDAGASGEIKKWNDFIVE